MLVEDTIIEAVAKAYDNAQKKVIDKILEEILKRPPTIDDYKDITRLVVDGETDTYYLAYKNMKLGTVTIKHECDYVNYKYEHTVTFTPFPLKDFLEPAVIDNKLNV